MISDACYQPSYIQPCLSMTFYKGGAPGADVSVQEMQDPRVHQGDFTYLVTSHLSVESGSLIGLELID